MLADERLIGIVDPALVLYYARMKIPVRLDEAVQRGNYVAFSVLWSQVGLLVYPD